MKELNKSNKYTMEVARLRYIAPEYFFLLNNLNPVISEMFSLGGIKQEDIKMTSTSQHETQPLEIKA